MGSRQSRFLSSSQKAGHEAGPLAATSASAPFIDSLIAQAYAADSRARLLEQRLSEQCEANRNLQRQLERRDEEISALRSALCCQQGSHQQPQGPLQQPRPPPEATARQPPAMGMSAAELQGAVARGAEQQGAAEPGGCGGDGGGAKELPAAAPPAEPPPPSSAFPPGPEPGDQAQLLRLDTPGVDEALPAASSFIAMPLPEAEAEGAAAAGASGAAPPASEQHGGSRGGASPAGADVGDDGALLGPAAAPAPRLPPLLAVEVRRTDRAHAALLFSSRQAQRLSLQLAAATIRAAELHEELHDWRSACLDNHRQLARLRRAAPAGAAPRE